ncbi:MAG TPA: hypothetical protein PKN47_04090, partial [Nitrospira sp.]|nr:hypothetical protein [Nitrospira sp.]
NGWPTCVGISGRLGLEYAHAKQLTFGEFIACFKSALGAITGLLGGLPILAKLSTETGSFKMLTALAPPMNTTEVFLIELFVLGLIVSTYLVHAHQLSLSPPKLVGVVALLVLITVTSGLWFVDVSERVIIEVPTVGETIVGFERTEEARIKYEGVPDAEILQDNGVDNYSKEQIWTRDSLRSARIQVFMSYGLSLFPMIILFSAAMIYSCSLQPALNTPAHLEGRT